MKFLLQFCLVSLFLTPQSFAQDLLKERIWKLADRKKAIFFDKGVFYTASNNKVQKLLGIRNSYVPARGYERVVLDFSDQKPPRVYGHISKKEKKVYIDLFNTTLESKISNIKNAKYIDDVEFYNIENDQVSLELVFKSKVSFDVFYLENPARLVIDIKK